jgi:hypothetical protein
MVVVAAVALVVAFAAAQASRGNVRPRAVDADAVVRLARVNVGPAGAQADRSTTGASLSASGRYVAFVSGARDLVRDDTNHTRDVFVRDLRTSRTTRVSTSSTDAEGRRSERQAVDQLRRQHRRLPVICDESRPRRPQRAPGTCSFETGPVASPSA